MSWAEQIREDAESPVHAATFAMRLPQRLELSLSSGTGVELRGGWWGPRSHHAEEISGSNGIFVD